MNNEKKQTKAGQQYADAYETHYGSQNLKGAFAAYKQILADFPDSREAGYASSQIQNIVNATVPKAKRLESQIKLATAVFDGQS